MISLNWWARLAPLPLILAGFSPPLRAQSKNVLTVAPVDKLSIQRGASAEVRIKAQLQPGFHVNSNTPADDYLIPLKLTWAKEPLITQQIVYPKPQMEKYNFSEKPLSVFSGTFEIISRLKAPDDARNGPAILGGKLRYQACNDHECLAPRTLDVSVSVEIR